MNALRLVSLGMLLGLNCAIVWVPAALGSEAGIHSYSGHDAYDQAAGGTAEQSVAILVADVSQLVACSPSTGGAIAQSARATGGGLSGDDDYDPAAGGAPQLPL